MEKSYNPYDTKIAPKVKAAEAPAWQARQASKRRLVQVYHRLEKSISDIGEERILARKAKRLDDVQQFTEAIMHARMAVTYLRQVARSEFDKSLEELEAYK